MVNNSCFTEAELEHLKQMDMHLQKVRAMPEDERNAYYKKIKDELNRLDIDFDDEEYRS